MSVKYKVMPKGQPGVVGGGEIKYYAAIARESKVDLRTFLEDAQELNVAHSGAFLAVLETFLSRVNHYLLNGKAVDLGQLGTFYPAISSSAEDAPEDVSKESIRRFKVNFRPSNLLQERMLRVKFEKLAEDDA